MKRYQIYYKSLATGDWRPTHWTYDDESSARLRAFEQVRCMDTYQAAVVDSRFKNRPCDVFARDADGQIRQRRQRVHVKRQKARANG
jgi:hypothetical protein